MAGDVSPYDEPVPNIGTIITHFEPTYITASQAKALLGFKQRKRAIH